MAYVYRHIRLDKNEVFYIGIGAQKNFKRAYTHSSRNKYWKNIVNLTDYKVEIILDDISWEEACDKEKEYIKLYGRKDKFLGTLSNMTDGGEGTLGCIPSRESVERGSKKRIGLKVSEELKERLRNLNKCKKVLQYNLDMKLVNTFVSLKEASRKTKFSLGNLSKACNNLIKQVYGFIWRFEEMKYIENTNKKIVKQNRRIEQTDINGKSIKFFDSVNSASTETNIPKASISNCCFANLNEFKYSAYKYKWRFIDKIYYI